MNNITPVIPTKKEILSWIKTICNMGYRMPGSEADHKVEKFLVQILKKFGISEIGKDDLEVPLWDPKKWKFLIEIDHKKKEIPSFYLAYTEFTGSEGISGELIYVQSGRDIDFQKKDVKGKIAIIDFRNPPLTIAPWLKFALYVHDPDHTIPDDYSHPATFRFVNWESFYRAYKYGAIGVIGILKDHPGGIKEYFFPADHTASDPRPIPGLYIGREDGKELKKELRKNKDKTIKGTIIQSGKKGQGITSNIFGVIPGKTNDIILISSHHDAPFNNAVQDASGSGIVLALAKYFAQFPPKTFNKSLLFLFTAAHFYEEIGGKKFIEKYQNDLIPRVFTSIHIEHIAKEYLEKDGKLVYTGYPEPRAIFVSSSKQLISFVKEAVIKHNLQRTLMVSTNFPIGVATDGKPFHEKAHLPIISLASAPFYIYNPIDTIEKLAVDEFEPLTNAFIDIIQSLDKISREELGLK